MYEVLRPGAPGVVLIHEIWGVNPHIRSVADRLAAQGYAVIAPDLLGFEVTLPPPLFQQAYKGDTSGLDEAQRAEFERLKGVIAAGATPAVLAAIDAAVAKLRARGSAKVAVMGFCLGGHYTWAHAYAGGQADAFAPFYGRVPAERHPEAVRGPLEGHYGAEDHGIPYAAVQAAAAELADGRIFVYAGAPHAFFNDTREVYHPEAAALAWERLLAFFARSL